MINEAFGHHVHCRYRKLALQWHPDKHTEDEEKEKAEKTFKKIAHAYEILSDSQLSSLFEKFQKLRSRKRGFPSALVPEVTSLSSSLFREFFFLFFYFFLTSSLDTSHYLLPVPVCSCPLAFSLLSLDTLHDSSSLFWSLSHICSSLLSSCSLPSPPLLLSSSNSTITIPSPHDHAHTILLPLSFYSIPIFHPHHFQGREMRSQI